MWTKAGDVELPIPKLRSGSVFKLPRPADTAAVADQLDSVATTLGRQFRAVAAHQRGGHLQPRRGAARHLGIAESTWNRWRSQYGGMKADEAKRLRQLEAENARLKKLLAEDAPIDQVGLASAA